MQGRIAGTRGASRTLAAVLATALTATMSTANASAGSPGHPVHRAHRLTERVVGELNHPFVAARHRLERLSTRPSVRDHDGDRCNRAMRSRTVPSRYTAFGAADRAGDVYCLSQPLTSPINIADRPYFLRAIGIRGFAVGDFQIGRATGVDSIGIGYPSRSESGRINGIVLSPLVLDWFDRRVEAVRPGRTLDLLVVDDHGTVLGRSGARRTPVGRNVSYSPLVKAMLMDNRGSGRFHLLGRHSVASAFDTVPATGGSVHVAVSVRR